MAFLIPFSLVSRLTFLLPTVLAHLAYSSTLQLRYLGISADGDTLLPSLGQCVLGSTVVDDKVSHGASRVLLQFRGP